MKTREDLVLRQVGETWALFPIGNALREFGHIIQLNDTGAFIYDDVERGLDREEVIADMVEQFGIDEKRAATAYDGFCENMLKVGMMYDGLSMLGRRKR